MCICHSQQSTSQSTSTRARRPTAECAPWTATPSEGTMGSPHRSPILRGAAVAGKTTRHVQSALQRRQTCAGSGPRWRATRRRRRATARGGGPAAARRAGGRGPGQTPQRWDTCVLRTRSVQKHLLRARQHASTASHAVETIWRHEWRTVPSACYYGKHETGAMTLVYMHRGLGYRYSRTQSHFERWSAPLLQPVERRLRCLLCCLLVAATAGTCSLAALELSWGALQHRASRRTHDVSDMGRTAPRPLRCLPRWRQVSENCLLNVQNNALLNLVGLRESKATCKLSCFCCDSTVRGRKAPGCLIICA